MRPILIVLAIVLGCATAGALLTSRVYWGYWIVLPSADWAVSPVASTQRFTSFSCCTDAQSGPKALAEAAQSEWEGAGDAPIRSLPLAMIRHGLEPATEDAVPTKVLVMIRDTLDKAGVLAEAEAPDYKYAKSLRGHVAIGRDTRGEEVIVAALFSGEVSNDHHAYYEAVFARTPAGGLKLLGVRRYWWDFAGLEGFAHWLGALLGAMIGVVCSCAFLFGWWPNRTGGRRESIDGAALHPL